jgi:transcriptional regulator with XRE-family HTH domain
MNIGNRLKSLRIEKQFEPLDMAIKIGVSETTYRRYERNEASPDLNVLDRIANALDNSVLDLIANEQNIQNNTFKKEGIAVAQNLGVINGLSEKLIEQFENRIKDKDYLIA